MEKTFTVHLSKKLLEKLAIIAKKNQRSMSGQMRWLIANAEIPHSVREHDLGSEACSENDEEANEL